MFEFYISKQGENVILSNSFNCFFVFNRNAEIITTNMIEDKYSKKIFDNARKKINKVLKQNEI